MKSYHSVTLSLKKRLLDNRLTLTAQVANLFDRSQRFVAETETFVRDLRVSNDWQPRRFVLTVNYNFKTGKSFKARQGRERRRRRKGTDVKEADIGNRNCTGVFLKSSRVSFSGRFRSRSSKNPASFLGVFIRRRVYS